MKFTNMIKENHTIIIPILIGLTTCIGAYLAIRDALTLTPNPTGIILFLMAGIFNFFYTRNER